MSPTPLGELDLNTIVEKLAEHYRPDTVEIAERFKFFKRQQSDEEGVTDYMAELRKLAKTCNFGHYLDTALRDQLVCGLKDPRIQALERARAMEAVAKEAKHLQFEGGNTEADEAPTHQMRRTKCHRCGSTDHVAAKCAHKDKRCHKCDKIGHLARVCKSSKAKVGTRSRNTGSGDESDELGATLAGVHKVAQGGSKYRKLITTLKIKGKNIDFEVDTGAELSTIPAALYRAKLKQVGLEPSSEREALAIVFAVKKFHQNLCGRPFTLVTDHQPLCKILGHNQEVPTLAAAQMQRWALILSAYSIQTWEPEPVC